MLAGADTGSANLGEHAGTGPSEGSMSSALETLPKSALIAALQNLAKDGVLPSQALEQLVRQCSSSERPAPPCSNPCASAQGPAAPQLPVSADVAYPHQPNPVLIPLVPDPRSALTMSPPQLNAAAEERPDLPDAYPAKRQRVEAAPSDASSDSQVSALHVSTEVLASGMFPLPCPKDAGGTNSEALLKTSRTLRAAQAIQAMGLRGRSFPTKEPAPSPAAAAPAAPPSRRNRSGSSQAVGVSYAGGPSTQMQAVQMSAPGPAVQGGACQAAGRAWQPSGPEQSSSRPTGAMMPPAPAAGPGVAAAAVSVALAMSLPEMSAAAAAAVASLAPGLSLPNFSAAAPNGSLVLGLGQDLPLPIWGSTSQPDSGPAFVTVPSLPMTGPGGAAAGLLGPSPTLPGQDKRSSVAARLAAAAATSTGALSAAAGAGSMSGGGIDMMLAGMGCGIPGLQQQGPPLHTMLSPTLGNSAPLGTLVPGSAAQGPLLPQGLADFDAASLDYMAAALAAGVPVAGGPDAAKSAAMLGSLLDSCPLALLTNINEGLPQEQSSSSSSNTDHMFSLMMALQQQQQADNIQF